jgi:hypothetical protein
MFLFTILELSDTFTGYRLCILFVLAGLLLRNYLSNYFKLSDILKKGKTTTNQPVTNNLKALSTNPTQLTKVLVSQIQSLFKNLLRK